MGGKSKKITIGYTYRVGMHLIICTGLDELKKIVAGDKTVWVGSVTANTVLTINKPNLFGGEKKEGGIVGDFSICFGSETQPKEPYLVSQLGDENTTAFRGVFGMVLRSPVLTSMSPYIKPLGVEGRRQAAADWYPETCNINDGSANGVHIIYEAITNDDWGMGLEPSSTILDSSFRAAALTIYNEGLGLSLVYTKQTKILDFVKTILSHIHGILSIDRTTGRYKIRLIREPSQAELDNALVLDEDTNCTINKFQRPSYSEIINEIIVNYRPRGFENLSSVTVQDLAAIRSQNNAVVSQTLSFPGIDTEENAHRVALREVRLTANPLSSLQIDANREAWPLSPGDIVIVNSTRLGISGLVVRVFSLNYGELAAGTISLETTQDVFSLPNTSFIAPQPPLFSEPIGAAADAENQLMVEANYWDLEKVLDLASFEALDDSSSYIQVVIGTPANPSFGYDLVTSTSPSGTFPFAEVGSFTETIETLAPITKAQVTVTIPLLSPLRQGTEGSYVYIGSEMLLISSITSVQLTLARGVVDTTPQDHPAGTIVYFAGDDSSSDDIEYAATEVIYARALVRTAEGILDQGSATTNSLTLTGRQAKPWLPARIAINGSFFPEYSASSAGTIIDWVHRDRTMFLNNLVSFYDNGSSSPEAGTSYEILIYGENNTLLTTIDAGVASSYTYTRAQEIADSPAMVGELTDRVLSTPFSPTPRQNYSLRIFLRSRRSAILSHQSYDHTFTRSGYGYGYGNHFGE